MPASEGWLRYRLPVEVFANDRTVITSRIYPTCADSTEIGVFAEGGDVALQSLDVWEMKSIRSAVAPGLSLIAALWKSLNKPMMVVRHCS